MNFGNSSCASHLLGSRAAGAEDRRALARWWWGFLLLRSTDMLKTLTCLFSTLIIFSVPNIASACRVYQSEAMKMERVYSAVVIATITEARYLDTSEPMPGWQAIAKLKQTAEGKK